jgi:hypothetical protein
MGEFIGEFIVTLILNFPGALIRWSVLKLFGSKKSYMDILKEDPMMNSGIFILTIFAAFMAYLAIR